MTQKLARLIALGLAVSGQALFAHGTSRAPFFGVNNNPVTSNFGPNTNCTRCHTSFVVPNPDNEGRVQLLSVGPGGTQPTPLATYTPGRTQRLRVTVSHPNPEVQRWGFMLSAHIMNTGLTQAGSFTPGDDTNVACQADYLAPCQEGQLQFISHKPGDTTTRRGQTGSASWDFDWTPPNTDVGDVQFYLAGNAANGNGNNQGDRIYLTQVRVRVEGACPQTPRNAPSGLRVVNGASFQPGIAANGMFTIFGLGFTDPGLQRVAGPGDIRDGKFPTNLACVAVEVDGRRVPLTFVKNDQINAQAPTLDTNGPVNVRVILNPGGPNELPPVVATGVPFSTVAPAFFTFSGRSIAAQHADFSVLADPSVVPEATPARPGETVILYGTGFGFTEPVYQAGELAGGQARLRDVQVTIGGTTLRPEDVLYAGLSPSSITGLYQFNVRLPDSLPTGSAAVQIRVGGRTTQEGATIPVQRPQ